MRAPSRFANLSVEVAHNEFDVHIAVPDYGKASLYESRSASRSVSRSASPVDFSRECSFFCDEIIESPVRVGGHRVVQAAARVRRNSAFPIPVATKRVRSAYECSSGSSTSSSSRRGVVFLPPAGREAR